MSREALRDLIERARGVKMTPDQKEEQRRSFAYGNTKIENERITRETVDEAASELFALDRTPYPRQRRYLSPAGQ